MKELIYQKYHTGTSFERVKIRTKKDSSFYSRISNSVLLGIICIYSLVLPLGLITQLEPATAKPVKSPEAIVQETYRPSVAIRTGVTEPAKPAARANQVTETQPGQASNPWIAQPVKPASPTQSAAQPRDPVVNYNPGAGISGYQFQMLARIISAEAKGEPLKGQVAVGAVILNRMESGKFPKTIAANVLKRGQFEPVANGHIWHEPTPSAIRAARMAINGWDPTNGAIYFFNPAKTNSRWIKSRPVVTRIGNHLFAV